MADELLLIGTMNITLKTKIRYNGQEYSSIDQLPPEVRAVYERAIAGGSNLIVKPGITTRLVVNGKTFSSAADMSAAEKKLYDDAMQLVRDDVNASGKPTAIESSAMAVSAATDTKPAATDFGWLTRRQIQLIAVVAGILLALALIVAWRL